MDFEVGDVVKLKSGGSNMAVVSLVKSLHGEHPLVECCWPDNGDKKVSFPSELLEKASDETLTLADEVFKKLYTNY